MNSKIHSFVLNAGPTIRLFPPLIAIRRKHICSPAPEKSNEVGSCFLLHSQLTRKVYLRFWVSQTSTWDQAQ